MHFGCLNCSNKNYIGHLKMGLYRYNAGMLARRGRSTRSLKTIIEPFSMEMQGQDEPQKRIKVEEEDHISVLPDCLILEILSRLPSTKEAIKTSALSKRWQYVWTSVSNLIFVQDVSGNIRTDSLTLSDFLSTIDQTLAQCRHVNLNKFVVDTTYTIRFESQVRNFIRHAINRNVEHLVIELDDISMLHEFDLSSVESFFTNSSFTCLRLDFCMFNPTGAISWDKLTSLTISHIKLNEDVIQNILSGSPQLETFELNICYGFKRLDIDSKSVKKLVLSGYGNPDYQPDPEIVIEINAPYIISLTIQNYFVLQKNIVLLNVSSLVQAHINCTRDNFYCEIKPWIDEEEMLERLLEKLGHVKELTYGNSCSEAMNRLRAKTYFWSWNSNLKFVNDYFPRVYSYRVLDRSARRLLA